MRTLAIAMATEWLKFHNALLPRLATVGMVVVPSIVSPLSVRGGGGSALSAGNWAQYFDLTAGTVATGGVFGFGLVIVWLFGREFVEGTITGLFGLPVPRQTLALSKIVLFMLWACATTLALAAALIAVGGVLRLGTFDAVAWSALSRFIVVSVLTALLTIPFAWVASISRDYLAPIGAMLAVVVLTSVLADLGLGAWLPYAAPGLWAASGGTGDAVLVAIQLFDVVLLALAFAAILIRSWKLLEI